MKRGLIFLLIIFNISVFSQVRKIALLEEATNASCGPCAANNPTLQKFVTTNFGGVISVRYHAWWPGTDPMYSSNTTDNQNRIHYYNISGVPNYMIDGENLGVPSDPAEMENKMNESVSKTSPVELIVNKEIASDTIHTSIKIKAVGDLTENNLRLRVAVIERLVHYGHPPGTNGEKDFGDVMRKMLPDGNGTALSPMAAGDSATFNFSVPVNSEWNKDDLAVVAWIQNDDNKKVIQANIDFPTFVLKSNVEPAKVLQLNSNYKFAYSIKNENKDTLHVNITTEKKYAPDDWEVKILYGGGEFDGLTLNIPPADSAAFQVSLNTTSTAGFINLSVKASNLDDPHGYGFGTEFFGAVINGSILLIDDDGGSSWEETYIDALKPLPVDFTMVPEKYIGTIIGANAPENFHTIIWNVGWGFPALARENIDFLVNFLNQSGKHNLLIAGQDIGWDIFDQYGMSNFKQAQNFYHDYLGADYVADDAGSTSIQGISGNPISNGISFSLARKYSLYPESIKAHDTTATEIFKYSNGKFAGVSNHVVKSGSEFKTVYLGFGMELINNEDTKNFLMQRILGWFGEVTGIEEKLQNALPLEFKLSQNYPNPFGTGTSSGSSSTTIKYSLPGVGTTHGLSLQLVVYDVLGREVATLVNKAQPAGNYSVKFNAANLPSGVYFYELKISGAEGNFKKVKKLMIIK